MRIFLLATVVSYMVLFISRTVIDYYLIRYYDDKDKLNNSLWFNAFAVTLLISYCIFYTSITVICAYIFKQLFF